MTRPDPATTARSASDPPASDPTGVTRSRRRPRAAALLLVATLVVGMAGASPAFARGGGFHAPSFSGSHSFFGGSRSSTRAPSFSGAHAGSSRSTSHAPSYSGARPATPMAPSPLPGRSGVLSGHFWYLGHYYPYYYAGHYYTGYPVAYHQSAIGTVISFFVILAIIAAVVAYVLIRRRRRLNTLV